MERGISITAWEVEQIISSLRLYLEKNISEDINPCYILSIELLLDKLKGAH